MIIIAVNMYGQSRCAHLPPQDSSSQGPADSMGALGAVRPGRESTSAGGCPCMGAPPGQWVPLPGQVSVVRKGWKLRGAGGSMACGKSRPGFKAQLGDLSFVTCAMG